MTFEMQVVSNTPLIGDENLDSAAKKFFEQIGYLSKGSDPTIPYKIFADFYVDDSAVCFKKSATVETPIFSNRSAVFGPIDGAASIWSFKSRKKRSFV